jgi:hypothetical protein
VERKYLGVIDETTSKIGKKVAKVVSGVLKNY